MRSKMTALMILVGVAGLAILVSGCKDSPKIVSPSDKCVINADCPGGYVCAEDGECKKVCNPNKEEDCQDSYCHPEKLYCVECLKDEHCEDGKKCIENICKDLEVDVDEDASTEKETMKESEDSTDKEIVETTDGDIAEADQEADQIVETDTDDATDVEISDLDDTSSDIDEDDLPDGDIDEDTTDPEPDLPEGMICVPDKGYCADMFTYKKCNHDGTDWITTIDCHQDENQQQCVGQICDPELICKESNYDYGTPCNDGNIHQWPDVCDGDGNCVKGKVAARIELIWKNRGADLDLHLLNPEGDIPPDMQQDPRNPNDCNWGNCNLSQGKMLDWGVQNDDNDNPRLLADDINGTGPEIIEMPRFTQPGDYMVWIRHFNANNTQPNPEPFRIKVVINEQDTYFFDNTTDGGGSYKQVLFIRYHENGNIELIPICTSCDSSEICTPHGCDNRCNPGCTNEQQCRGGICITDCRYDDVSCPEGFSCNQLTGVCFDAGIDGDIDEDPEEEQQCANLGEECIGSPEGPQLECCGIGVVCCLNAQTQTGICCEQSRCFPGMGCL